MPLSQFSPANFTGLPDSHQPAACVAPALANRPMDSNVVSRVLFDFIVVTLLIMNGLTAVQEASSLVHVQIRPAPQRDRPRSFLLVGCCSARPAESGDRALRCAI